MGNGRIPCGAVGKESVCNGGDVGSNSRSGRPLGGRTGNHSSILAWKTPWMEEPGGLQYVAS